MFVVIKDGLNIVRIVLEKTNMPYRYKGIEILKQDDDYFFNLKKGYCFIDGTKIKKVEIKTYSIKHKDHFNNIEIYVYSDDNGFNDFKLYEITSFIYADNPKAPIINKDDNLKGVYLYLKGNTIQCNYKDLLLNNRIYNNEELKNGDKVCLLNFIFYYYDEFLYINNFKTVNRLSLKNIEEKLIKYEALKPRFNTYLIPQRKELELDVLKEYHPIRIPKQRKLVFQIGPSITMSMAMLSIAGINVYNNYLNNQPFLNSLVYILMPLTMLISGVMWPIIGSVSEKKSNLKELNANKNKYLDYLLDYDQNLSLKIKDFLKQENNYFFDEDIDEEKMFYITGRSDCFLNLSIGYTTYKKDFSFKEEDDEDVRESLSRIKYRLNNIENCPYFLDLKKYKTISIYSYNSKRIYFMKKFLLELAFKYHYDDFYLAIYSEDLSIFNEFFNLPQLLFNNSRLTLNKKREIQELNSIKLDKPLILLAFDYIDYVFTNKDIKLLYFTNNKNDIYKDSDILIEYLDDTGYIYTDEKILFKYKEESIPFYKYTKLLGAYQSLQSLNKTIRFKDIDKELNVKNYYLSKQEGLRGDFAMIGKEILNFDLHESKSGPHGLIGGSTGSGKSELIISLLLSLCLRYRPDYLNVVLIDYKGGGIKESLTYADKCIPHLIASVDNLEIDTFERLIVAIDFECKRRQRLFKTLSNKAMTSIMNIDDYLNNDYERFNLPKIAHLLIVVDEFAELKKENPLIIKNLISFSRIGRSLGLHLILATQRPSGIIDDEIWSNSHFKIALKVLSDKDSNDIIKVKDAAYLNNPGEFYLNIDDNLVKAKTIYSKNDINNGEAYEVSLLDNRLDVIKKKSIKRNKPFTEASFIVNKINEVCDELSINIDKLSFNKPASLKRKEIIGKYKLSNNEIILGEKDDYLNALVGPLFIPKDNNAFIYSSRNNEINNILNCLDKNTIVIGSKYYTNPYITDSLLYGDNKDIYFLFSKLIKDNIDMYLVIEDLSCLLSYNENISTYLYQLLRRSSVSNIKVIAISKQSSISFKLLNSFKYKYAIEILDNQDLMNIFPCRNEYKGTSYFFEEKLISFVPCKIENFIDGERVLSNYLEHIPEKINMVKNEKGLLLGYSIEDRKSIYLNDNEDLIISSFDEIIIEKLHHILDDYQNIKIYSYKEALNHKDEYRYLWFGEGLYNQRLFYVDGKEDLKDNEAYYLKGNKGELIRTINYE